MSKFLPCAVCGTKVRLSNARMIKLCRHNVLPVCRRNGCWRIVGRPSVGSSRVRRVVNRPIINRRDEHESNNDQETS